MSVIISYPFDNPLDYVFDSDKIEVVGGEAQLKLVDNPGQEFIEDFTDDTGFVYDNTKAEFVGGVCRSKDQRPESAMFGATFTSDVNGNWGGGVLTGTPSGGASVSGGKLDLTGSTKALAFSAVGNANSQQVGAVKFKFTPNYAGAPPSTQMLFSISRALGSLNNIIMLYHNSVRNLFLSIYNSSGVAIIGTVNLGLWSQTQGIEYEFELNYDITTGETRLFINGVQFGATQTATGVRSSDINHIRIGADYNNSNLVNGYFDDIEIFSTVQHTANYTLGYEVPENIYSENYITLPEMEYTGSGTLISFDDFETTETNAPHYTLQIGRSGIYLYWNGAAWVTSNSSYAQANDKATFIAHLATLPIEGEVYGQFRVHFANGISQQNIDIMTLSLTAQIYPTDNPTIKLAQNFRIDELLAIAATITASGTDAIKAILENGGVNYYWNETAWVTSSGYSQSNTIAEIETNKATFTTDAIDFNIVLYLHSSTGITTPSISMLTITYDFAGDPEDEIYLCSVYWYSRKVDGSICEEAYTILPSSITAIYKDNVSVCREPKQVTADENGRVEVDLIENVNMVTNTGLSTHYIVKRGSIEIAKISVPVLPGALLWDILAT